MQPGDRVQVLTPSGLPLDCELVAGPDRRGLVLVRHFDHDRELLRCCCLVSAARVRPHPAAAVTPPAPLR